MCDFDLLPRWISENSSAFSKCLLFLGASIFTIENSVSEKPKQTNNKKHTVLKWLAFVFSIRTCAELAFYLAIWEQLVR